MSGDKEQRAIADHVLSRKEMDGEKGVRRESAEKPAKPPGALATHVGKWIHRNKGITDTNPIGYTIYQFARSAVASVPYGVSMAATWLVFQKTGSYGKKLSETAKNPSTKEFGRRLLQFTSSPAVRASAMIGTSFSLYRGTSKLAKWVNESLFNPNDSEEQTIKEVHNLPSNLWKKVKEVTPAEVNSTPVSAVVLGFIVSYFKGGKKFEKATENATKAGMELARKEGRAWQFFKEKVYAKETNFVEQAAINTVGYSMFFELGDRRFKDKQISRGMWSGDAHALGSSSRSNPSLLEKPLSPDGTLQADDKGMSKYEPSPHVNDKLFFLTSEPSVPRFFFRRVVPTGIGMTAYTAFKFRGAPMFLGHFAKAADNETVTLKKWSHIPKHAWREGAATSLFFLIPFVTDKYVKWYDNFVNGLEAKVSGKKEPNLLMKDNPIAPEDRPRIQHNNEKLLSKLNEKERGAMVAAH